MLIIQVGDGVSYWSGEQTEGEVRGQPSALTASQSSPQTPQVKKKQTEELKEKENIVFVYYYFLNGKFELLPHSSSQSNMGVWTEQTPYFHSHTLRLLVLNYLTLKTQIAEPLGSQQEFC